MVPMKYRLALVAILASLAGACAQDARPTGDSGTPSLAGTGLAGTGHAVAGKPANKPICAGGMTPDCEPLPDIILRR